MSVELDRKWLELINGGRAILWPGMLYIDMDQPWFCSVASCVRRSNPFDKHADALTYLLDWDDSATVGALMGQVRKRYRNPLLYIEPNGDEGWGLASPVGMVMHEGSVISAATEAGVCLHALGVAP